MFNYRRYLVYLFRWQISTPLLAGVNILLVSRYGYVVSVVIANLIGGLIFFWVDKFIFTTDILSQWEVKENISCIDCGKVGRGYRLVKSENYDRTDADPEYRCEECSKRKSEELKKRGVKF